MSLNKTTEPHIAIILNDTIDKLRIAILSGDTEVIESELDRLGCKLADEYGDTVIAKSFLRTANKLLIHYPDEVKQSIKDDPYN